MKVLIADKFEESGRQGLLQLGCELVYEPELNGDTLTEAIRQSGAQVLIVRSTQVTAPMLEAGNLSLVVRAGAGYNTIDVKAASARGIHVSNCPGKNSIAVAELAFGLILALDRRIADNVQQLREGKWNKKEFSKARGVYGKTLGLIGVGNIGQHMITRAKAFGMEVAACDLVLTPENAQKMGIRFCSSPEEVAAQSDILSVHVALNSSTRGLIGTKVFDAMKPGAYFINTSRGEVVDQAALKDAIEKKGLRVGLDVYAVEPTAAVGPFEDPIVQMPNVYGTHHIGASTDQAQEAIAEETVRIIRSFRESGTVPNLVNPAK